MWPIRRVDRRCVPCVCDPLLPLLSSEEVEAVRFRLSYRGPLTGGGVCSYFAAGRLSIPEAQRLLTRIGDQQDQERRMLAALHNKEWR